MNEWEKLNEKSWPERKEFYGELNIEKLQMEITWMQKKF